MSKLASWLNTESERWVRERIVTADQAARIRALYPVAKTAAPWGLIVFCGLGAAIVGLGVILLLAYNWDEIPKLFKLGLILGGTAAAHGTGLWLRGRDGWRAGMAEVAFLLGSMLFGAGIWLVAQIYNIDEHYPNGFLFWGLGALALAWALDSVPQGILAAVALTIWGLSECLGFDRELGWALVLLAAGLAPLVWRRRSALLGTVVLSGAYALLLANAGSWGGGSAAFAAALALSTGLIAMVRLRPAGEEFSRLESVIRFLGWSGFLVCTYLLGFDRLADDLLRWRDGAGSPQAQLIAYRWAPLALATVLWGRLLMSAARGESARVPWEEWLCPIGLLYCTLLGATGTTHETLFVSLVFNLILLGVATMWMVRGCREGLLRETVLGSVLLAALVLARYFDLFDSLAARGLAFLLLGGLLFAEGFFYRRMRQAGEREGGAS
jgi:uncharacterized membrane protein